MAKAHLYGTPVSPGIALGTIHFLHLEAEPEMRRIPASRVEEERALFSRAAEAVREDLLKAARKVPEDLREYREIIHAQVEMARDPKFLDTVLGRIGSELVDAAFALNEEVERFCEVFGRLDDPYLRDRAQDVRVVGLRIRRRLSGEIERRTEGDDLVLAADDLSPADVMDLDLGRVRGIVTREGGLASHTSILARGMHIPALVNVSNLLVAAREGDAVILDALGGNVLISPSDRDAEEYAARAREYSAWRAAAARDARWPADTRDAVRVSVFANIERPEEVGELAETGADGIGLYRTEFAFFGDETPTEDDLFREYASVVRGTPFRTVFRTIDCGGDKIIRAREAVREPNPALGLRGIRFSLHHQALFRTQLRAILRAAAVGDLSVMLPMISTVEEVRATRRILQEVDQELSMRGVEHRSSVPLGVMVETPAAMLVADALAMECDFFSIGTNDLIHYLMAIDRNNRRVAYLGDAMHPAVVRSLKRVIDAAHREGLSVSACGELSSDPYGVALMLGMGIDSLSVPPAFLPGVKRLVRRLDAGACAEIAVQVLMSTDIPACRHLVKEVLQKALGRELAFLSSAVIGGDS